MANEDLYGSDPYLESHPFYPKAREIMLRYLRPGTQPETSLRQGYAAHYPVRMHAALRALTHALEIKQWRCFHCDEVFYTEQAAAAHFGDDQTVTPGCVKMLTTHEKELLAQTDKWIERATAAEEKLEQCEYEKHLLNPSQYKYFKNCRTMNDVVNEYESMEGRALAAEARLDYVRKMVTDLGSGNEILDAIAKALDPNQVDVPDRPKDGADLDFWSVRFGRRVVCLNVPGFDSDGRQTISVTFEDGTGLSVRDTSISLAWGQLRAQADLYRAGARPE